MVSSRKVAGAAIGLLLLLQSLSSPAQTWSEWWNQKSTQRKYLIQQIAALQIYIGYAWKGYGIAKDGLHTISDITNGEFGLHKTYFASLSAINPAVKNNPQVNEIIAFQHTVIDALDSWKPDGWNPEEWDYLRTVRQNMLADCSRDMDELTRLLKNGDLQMTDEERLKQLAKLWRVMQDKAVFAQTFTGQLILFQRQRTKENTDVNQIQKLYETS